MLIEFKKEERWKQLTDDKDKPFQSWEDYVQYPEPNGLGMAPASAKLVMEELDDSRLLGDVLVADAADRKAKEQQPHGGDRSKLDNKKGDINLAYPTGTSRAAALRRLRKDRPDIHARVLRGELTPNAGMIEAGFRKKPKSRKLSRVDRAKKLVEAMTKTEFQAFKKWVIER
jgi:hypothetical protein